MVIHRHKKILEKKLKVAQEKHEAEIQKQHHRREKKIARWEKERVEKEKQQEKDMLYEKKLLANRFLGAVNSNAQELAKTFVKEFETISKFTSILQRTRLDRQYRTHHEFSKHLSLLQQHLHILRQCGTNTQTVVVAYAAVVEFLISQV